MRGTAGDPLPHGRAQRCIPAHAGNGAKRQAGCAEASVHPRACGERAKYGQTTVEQRGASPRMRGTVSSPLLRFRLLRCIPAHAGNGPALRMKLMWATVHPRACGERSLAQLERRWGAGASPRMRGTEALAHNAAAIVRCIPAHAGNGSTWPISQLLLPVHPRACGERVLAGSNGGEELGASPRMRGTGRSSAGSPAGVRCIPAHAGNGRRWPAAESPRPVHPRACGERRVAVLLADFHCGASPRMRGTVRGQRGTNACGRCIPAHAGNGGCHGSSPQVVSVHPRACGERDATSFLQARQGGASPRMRGTARRPGPAASWCRCIPAHAGNGGELSISGGASTVHPRACGEREVIARDTDGTSGASPRMRGTERRARGRDCGSRCIPAHAGNGPRHSALVFLAQVHPRACGERAQIAGRRNWSIGASPRMRGTAGARGLHRGPRRCIPAHAGNGPRDSRGTSVQRVHPRACGERSAGNPRKLTGGGASPRMRGTVRSATSDHKPARCIPAHARNGDDAGVCRAHPAVHPRACGERGLLEIKTKLPHGASPRMRGTVR